MADEVGKKEREVKGDELVLDGPCPLMLVGDSQFDDPLCERCWSVRVPRLSESCHLSRDVPWKNIKHFESIVDNILVLLDNILKQLILVSLGRPIQTQVRECPHPCHGADIDVKLI